MQYEVIMIDGLMYGIWDNTDNRWCVDSSGLVIHSPSKEFLQRGQLVNILAEQQ